jgi:hypothetical protein
MHFFTYRVYIPELSESIEIQAGDDLVELTWAPIEKLSEYKLSPPSETLFRKLGYLS